MSVAELKQNGDGWQAGIDYKRYTSPNSEPQPEPAPKATKKIAILGRAPSSVHLAPYADESWEIWSLGNAAVHGNAPSGTQKGPIALPRWDRLFELHDIDLKRGIWSEQYLNWLKEDHGKTIYICRPTPNIPYGTPIPWEAIFAKFGRYFNNSVSLMIAVALLEGATDLGVYGVDMAQSDPSLHAGNPEYQHQRPSCEFMLGYALGAGVNVTIPDTSDLLKCDRIYAYHTADPAKVKKFAERRSEILKRRDEFIMQKRQYQENVKDFEKLIAKFEGALEDHEYHMQWL